MKFQKIQDEIIYTRQRYRTQREMEDLFIAAGYTVIDTSFFEDYDDFVDINKRVKKESMVKVLNSKGNILILRPDITTGIIRSLIPRWEDGSKLKLFYSSTVFKNKADTGIHEDKQVGIEYLGENSYTADYEVIKLGLHVLEKYEANYILELGTSKYLNSLLKELNLPAPAERKIKILIYNKNRFDLTDFINELGLPGEIKELFINLLDFQGNFEEVVKKTKHYYANAGMSTALAELEGIKTYIEENEDLAHIYFDLATVPAFDYYEGIIFKGYYPQVYRPILSGGRYDYLTARVGRNVPAVGFTIDMNQLMKVLYKEEV